MNYAFYKTNQSFKINCLGCSDITKALAYYEDKQGELYKLPLCYKCFPINKKYVWYNVEFSRYPNAVWLNAMEKELNEK